MCLRSFEIRDGLGLVLSDRSGAYQAFWSQGTLTNEDLVRNLQKYANLTSVRVTETAGRSSNYPPGEEQGTPARRAGRRGAEYSTTPVESQRRLRLFQGRMSRRTAS